MSTFSLALPALREDNPRDFLAALGLLRLVDLRWPDLDACLSWPAARRVPTLHLNRKLADDWSEMLLNDLKSLIATEPCPLFHGDIIKIDPVSFRDAVERAQRFLIIDHPLHRLPVLLYACYSGQLTGDDGMIEPSGFSFGNGQSGKKLLLDVRQLAAALHPESLSNSVAGNNKPIAAKSLRWNPSEFRPAAYRTHDPGSKHNGDEVRDHPARNVLAFIGLTFYPSVPTLDGGRTSGFHVIGHHHYFCWPVWSLPLSPDVIATLVGCSATAMRSTPEVDQIWRSQRFDSDKSLYFAPAELSS